MYFYVAYHVSCSALLGITTYIYIYILSAILLLLYTTVYLHKCASLHKMHIACLIQLHRETRHVWCFVNPDNQSYSVVVLYIGEMSFYHQKYHPKTSLMVSLQH